MKGIILESFAVVMLAVAVIGMIVVMKLGLLGGGKTLLTLSERQEDEGFKAGVNSILENTEQKTGKKLLELMGIAANLEADVIDFGNIVGVVNVSRELEWRFDAIYGKGHWYLQMPFPGVRTDIQLIIIEDSSASMCDDVEAIKNDLPKIIEDLRSGGYDITATIYILPGGQQCCNGPSYALDCRGVKFTETSYFHCRDMVNLNCRTPPENEEDWGNGLACGIEVGPMEKWKEDSIKLGVILSDELPAGTEFKDGPKNKQSLSTGITAAKNKEIRVFTIKTATGKKCCPTCDNCLQECKVCLMWWDENWRWTKQYVFTKLQCEYDSVLTNYMKKMADETGGEMFTIDEMSQASDYLRKILEKATAEIKFQLEIGSPKPTGRNIRSATIPVPTTFTGEYTNAYIYQWS